MKIRIWRIFFAQPTSSLCSFYFTPFVLLHFSPASFPCSSLSLSGPHSSLPCHCYAHCSAPPVMPATELNHRSSSLLPLHLQFWLFECLKRTEVRFHRLNTSSNCLQREINFKILRYVYCLCISNSHMFINIINYISMLSINHFKHCFVT